MSIGGGQNFKGAIVTGKPTQLTVAITDNATILGMGYKIMLGAEQLENCWFAPPLVTFWEYHVH